MEKIYYKNYLNNINEAFRNGKLRGDKISGVKETFAIRNKLFSATEDEELYKSLILSNTNKIPKYHQKLGSHPDFKYLKESNGLENHYITSMFIDIKNSTALFRKYSPETVAYITGVIQKAAIHTCWQFDGYVQRLHGDGLFVYFGGKSSTHSESVLNAIKSASYFSYFIDNDLRSLFEEQGVDKIYTRIGIDTGEAEQVLWHLAGIGDCSEITTCSLHTSLAAHMQSNADSNGIMVGDNVRAFAKLDSEYFSIRKIENGEKEDRYIFQIPEENLNYTQWKFNWSKYLKDMNQQSISKANQLKEAAALISAGQAQTNRNGEINKNSGVQNQSHRFHL